MRAATAYWNFPPTSISDIPTTNVGTVWSGYGYNKHLPRIAVCLLCVSRVGGKKNLQLEHDFVRTAVDVPRVFHRYSKQTRKDQCILFCIYFINEYIQNTTNMFMFFCEKPHVSPLYHQRLFIYFHIAFNVSFQVMIKQIIR